MPLYLNEADVTGLVDMPTAIEVIQDAFAAKARGEAVNRPRLRLPLVDGNYNVMAATWADRGVVGQKSFTAGSAGVALDIVLYDAAGGGLLAVIEGKRLTALRTGAASGVAARWMHPEPGPIALIGTGIQAATQLEAVALATGSPSARVFSRRPDPCAAFAATMTDRLEMNVQPATSVEACVEGAAIVITVTNTAIPVVTGEMLSPGMLVVAVGCNSWLRCEVDVAAIERCDRVVVDDLEQARTECGDLMRAVEVGRLSWTSVAELADVVVGREIGRTSGDGIGLFESQGIAIEDVALAEYVYRRALEVGVGARLS